MKNKLNWLWAGIFGGLLASLLIYIAERNFYLWLTIPSGLLLSIIGMVTET